MGAAAALTPPPPPGFTIDEVPPPPPGFTMDAPVRGPDTAALAAKGNLHTLIPGQESAPPPDKTKQPSAIMGIPGALVTAASAIPAGLAGNVAGLVRTITSGLYGTPEGVTEGGKRAHEVTQALTYEPSPAGGRALEVAGKVFDASKLAGLNPAGPVAGAGNVAPLARAATSRVVVGANDVANALEAAREAKRAKLPPEQLRAAEAVRRGQEAGYTALPTQTNPSGINSALESVAGKVKTAQKVSQKNQPVTNKLAKGDIGVDAMEALSPEELAAVRKEQGAHYEAVRGAGVIPLDEAYIADTGSLSSRSKSASQSFPALAKDDTAALVEGLQSPALNVGGKPAMDASHAIDQISLLREKADQLWRAGDKTLSKANRKAADAIEGLIERHIADPANGADPALVENFRNARTKIAKSYDIESAINPSTGNVSGMAVARRGKKKPLSDGLETIQDFSRAQEDAVQRPEKIGSVPAGSIFDAAIMGAVSRAKGAGSLALDALSLGARPAIRSLITSKPYQKMFVQPNDFAKPGMVERIARDVADGPKREPGGMNIKPDPDAIPFTGADRPSMVAERMKLTEEPKPVGNEIDIADFLRELRMQKAGAVDEAQATEAARKAFAATKARSPKDAKGIFDGIPVSVLNGIFENLDAPSARK